MKINDTVEYVGTGVRGIVPVGTTGTVLRVGHGDCLIEWNYSEVATGRKTTLYWHRNTRALKTIKTQLTQGDPT